MHCFSMPDRLHECLDRGYAISFAGNVTYKSAANLAQAARDVPAASPLAETDAPHLTPPALQPPPKPPNPPAFVRPPLAFPAGLRGVDVAQLGAPVEQNAARLFGW